MGYRFEKLDTIEMCYFFMCFALICDIYLQQLGFRPVAMVNKLVQKYERHNCVQKEKQYT